MTTFSVLITITNSEDPEFRPENNSSQTWVPTALHSDILKKLMIRLQKCMKKAQKTFTSSFFMFSNEELTEDFFITKWYMYTVFVLFFYLRKCIRNRCILPDTCKYACVRRPMNSKIAFSKKKIKQFVFISDPTDLGPNCLQSSNINRRHLATGA